jgi:hypothetical protein
MVDDQVLVEFNEGFMHPKGIVDRRWLRIGDRENLAGVFICPRELIDDRTSMNLAECFKSFKRSY